MSSLRLKVTFYRRALDPEWTLLYMFLAAHWRKSADTGRQSKLHIEKPLFFWELNLFFLLWGEIGNYSTTVASNLNNRFFIIFFNHSICFQILSIEDVSLLLLEASSRSCSKLKTSSKQSGVKSFSMDNFQDDWKLYQRHSNSNLWGLVYRFIVLWLYIFSNLEKMHLMHLPSLDTFMQRYMP